MTTAKNCCEYAHVCNHVADQLTHLLIRGKHFAAETSELMDRIEANGGPDADPELTANLYSICQVLGELFSAIAGYLKLLEAQARITGITCVNEVDLSHGFLAWKSELFKRAEPLVVHQRPTTAELVALIGQAIKGACESGENVVEVGAGTFPKRRHN